MQTIEEYATQRRQALFRFAVVLCGDPVLADELTSDVLSKAFERWPQVAAADNIHAYVRRMLVNEYLSWQRRASRSAPHADLTSLLPPSADHAERYAERSALVAELSQLPPKQRAALVLRHYEGLSYAEIAAELGSGEIAVRTNVSRALRTLRIQLADDAAPVAAPAALTPQGRN